MQLVEESSQKVLSVRELNVYRKAFDTAMEIFDISKEFPREEKFALTDQTNRALSSIILNVAEGSRKNSDKDTRVYINRAQGSLNEVVACLDCALDSKYISSKQHLEFLERAASLAKRLQGFNKYLSHD